LLFSKFTDFSGRETIKIIEKKNKNSTPNLVLMVNEPEEPEFFLGKSHFAVLQVTWCFCLSFLTIWRDNDLLQRKNLEI
jgi:hypothetical protein